MEEVKDWLWLVKTGKGDFFVTVLGRWEQEEAAEKVQQVFERLNLAITGMIPRKRITGPDDALGTIVEKVDQKGAPSSSEWPGGFTFLAGKKLWQACGRGIEYEVQLVLLEKEKEPEIIAEEGEK